jgi:hypothetical protein
MPSTSVTRKSGAVHCDTSAVVRGRLVVVPARVLGEAVEGVHESSAVTTLGTPPTESMVTLVSAWVPECSAPQQRRRVLNLGGPAAAQRRARAPWSARWRRSPRCPASRDRAPCRRRWSHRRKTPGSRRAAAGMPAAQSNARSSRSPPRPLHVRLVAELRRWAGGAASATGRR